MADTTYTATDLPAVLYKRDFARLLGKSERTLERLRRAQQLPEPLPIPGRPCWSQERALEYARTGRRRR